MGKWLMNPRLHALVAFILVWQIASVIFPPIKVPDPVGVVESIVDLVVSGGAWGHVWATMARIIVGFLGSMLVGGILGVIVGMGGFWKVGTSDIVTAGFSVPAIAWAAICTLLLGISLAAPVLATVLTVFPYIAVNLAKGVEAIDRNQVTMARVFRIPTSQMFKDVILPSIMPQLMAAVRYGFALSWKIVTIAEFFGAASGMGYMIIYSYGMFDLQGVLAWSLLFTSITLFIEYGIFRPASRHLLRWRPEAM